MKSSSCYYFLWYVDPVFEPGLAQDKEKKQRRFRYPCNFDVHNIKGYLLDTHKSAIVI